MEAGDKQFFLVIAGVLVVVAFFMIFGKMTGNVVGDSGGPAPTSVGPSAEEQACMMQCMGCSSPGVGCTGDQTQCTAQCNVQKPESTPETSCMEECVAEGCGEFDFSCQNNNKDKCEEECDMKGDAPDESEMSAEQLCITKCVAAVDPMIRCGNSQSGETGGATCQKCAADCVHLYAGPCMDDAKLKAEQKECETCEHCYGEPVMGDSGEGWECIVGVECKDATSEWGDEAGTGPGIGDEGYVPSNAVESVLDSVVGFFKDIF